MNQGTIENRVFPRRDIKSRLPGRVVAGATRAPVEIVGVDVSAQGMGVIVDRYYEPGTELTFSFGAWTLTLEVMWCHREAFKKSFRRCGLRSKTAEVNLLELFTRAGCLI